MIFERTDFVTRLSFNMQTIGYDLAMTIMEVERQRLGVHGKKNLVKRDCRLAALCINTFSLKSVLQSKYGLHCGLYVIRSGRNNVPSRRPGQLYTKKEL